MAIAREYAGSATTSEGSQTVRFSALEALMNDGSDDITFGIDASTTSDQVRTLKPGEQYSALGLHIPCKVLYFIAASGTQAFRAWGIG